MNYQPFHVTWVLSTPMVVPDHPMHLDDLLAWARTQEAIAAGSVNPWAMKNDLPLERYETATDWCFKASWLDLAPIAEPTVLHYSRRSSPEPWSDAWERGVFGERSRPPPYDASRNATKGASIQLQQQLMSPQAWGVGDIERVRELLARIRSLGKLRRNCAGTVSSFSVEPAEPADYDRWQERNLPGDAETPAGYDATHALSRLRSPYWQPTENTKNLIPMRRFI